MLYIVISAGTSVKGPEPPSLSIGVLISYARYDVTPVCTQSFLFFFILLKSVYKTGLPLSHM